MTHLQYLRNGVCPEPFRYSDPFYRFFAALSGKQRLRSGDDPRGLKELSTLNAQHSTFTLNVERYGPQFTPRIWRCFLPQHRSTLSQARRRPDDM